MTLRCTHCGSPSNVVLTRHVPAISTNKSNSLEEPDEIETILRTRQCRKCRFKWKTIELYLANIDSHIGT